MASIESVAKQIIDLVKQSVMIEWIPCKDGLPEIGKGVLISCSGVLWLGYIDRDGFWNTEDWREDEPGADGVDAWMPLPEPYKETEDGD